MGPLSTSFDHPVTVTASDTVDDPAGPFAGLLIGGAGQVTLWPLTGPLASSGMTIQVLAGQQLNFAVKRIGVTNTTDPTKVYGLVHGSITQGFK